MPLFFCHCEVVVSSPKQSLLSGVTASLVCSFGEAVSKPDCFGGLCPLAVTPIASPRGRRFVSEAVSPFCSDKGVSLRARSIVCEAVSLFAQGLSLRGRSVVSEAVSLFAFWAVIASLAFSFGEAISSLTLWEYETASLCSQRQQKGEAISLFAPHSVTASLACSLSEAVSLFAL